MSIAKRGISLAVESSAFSRLIDLIDRRGDTCTTLLRVLTYHRVATLDEEPRLYPGLISVTPDVFDQQTKFLAANYHLLSFDEMKTGWSQGKLPPRSVMVTFDDAYCDFARNAWPIMQRYGVPAVLFVPTAFPDAPQREFWWDRLYRGVSTTDRRSLAVADRLLPLESTADRMAAVRWLTRYLKALSHRELQAEVDLLCRELGCGPGESAVLSWDELRGLASEGVTLGAHTRTHPLINRLSVDEARAEVLGSQQDLEREIGAVPRIFAYPAGGRNDDVARMLDDAGFEFAFCTARGVNDIREADRMNLRRINVGRRMSQAVLRSQLLPHARYLNRCFK